jgi:hypothetical protein
MPKLHRIMVKQANDQFLSNTYTDSEKAIIQAFRDNVVMVQNGYVSNSYTVTMDDENTQHQTYTIDTDKNALFFSKNISDRSNQYVNAMFTMLEEKATSSNVGRTVVTTKYVELANGQMVLINTTKALASNT